MEDTIAVRKRRGRSAAYPACTLEAAIDGMTKLKDNLGKGPYSRDEAAKALGYSGVTGASAGKIAACVHYGLLVRTGNSYDLSDLANRILHSTSDAERGEAIVEAFQTPTLYNKLLQAYAGQALPTMLPSILIRNYGIVDRAAENVAKTFRETAEFAGFLHNGVLERPWPEKYSGSDDQEPSTTGPSNITRSISGPSAPSRGGKNANSILSDKERNVCEAGDGWELTISLKYSSTLPRDVRKMVTDLFSQADDIIDELNALATQTSEVKHA